MSLEEYIYSEIKNAIFNRKIPLNSQLNEELLSEAFEVSRTPIRAVLKRLQYEKIVQSIPNKGTYIYQPTKKDIQDVFQLRVILEKESIKLACKTATEEQIKELEELTIKEEEYFKKGEYGKGIELTSNFHQKLLMLSGNEFMARYNQELINITNIYLAFHDTAKKESSDSPEEHRVILNALRERDVEASVKAVEEHFENINKHLNFEQNNLDVTFSNIFKPYNKKK